MSEAASMLVIREATTGDVPQILLHSRATGRFRMSEFTDAPDEDELRFWVSDPRSLVIVAVRCSEVVAYACGFFLSPKWFFFDTMLVAPRLRNRGIGKRLYVHLRTRCKMAGVQVIHGLVKAGGKGALGYWSKLGFEEGSQCTWVEDWLDDE